MSYDYNALVSKVSRLRRQVEAALQSKNVTASIVMTTTTTPLVVRLLEETVAAWEELSQHCPMTPLLWMQYAQTNSQLLEQVLLMEEKKKKNQDEEQKNSKQSDQKDEDDDMAMNAIAAMALQTRLETLELGLLEFPGSALLNLHYISLLQPHSVQRLQQENLDHARNTSSDTAMPASGGTVRFTVVNKNIPGCLAAITEAIAHEGLNIVQQINQSKAEIAYNILDIDTTTHGDVLSFKTVQERITMLPGVLSSRVIYGMPGSGYAKNLEGEYFV